MRHINHGPPSSRTYVGASKQRSGMLPPLTSPTVYYLGTPFASAAPRKSLCTICPQSAGKIAGKRHAYVGTRPTNISVVWAIKKQENHYIRRIQLHTARQQDGHARMALSRLLLARKTPYTKVENHSNHMLHHTTSSYSSHNRIPSPAPDEKIGCRRCALEESQSVDGLLFAFTMQTVAECT